MTTTDTDPAGRTWTHGLRVLAIAARQAAAFVGRYAGAGGGERSALRLAWSALGASHSGVALVRAGSFVVRNQAWTALDHAPGGEWRVEGRGYRTLHELALGEASRMGEEDVRELRAERSDPEQALALRVERLRTGAPPILLLLARDLTSRLRAEREAARLRELEAEQERTRAVGQLASGVAHDLNSVLHAMALRVEALRREGSAERREAGLDALHRLVTDAASRVARLQDLAHRRQDAPPTVVDLGAVAREAASALAPDGEARTPTGAALRIRLETGELPLVRGDAAELHHVLLGLLVNARDAMPGGGEIVVEGERRGATALVRVRDHGTGIAPEALPRLFDPFFTTKGEKGTGLGLAIARSVVLRLGGRIRAWNAEGGGAIFEIELPCAPAPRPEPRPTPPPVARRDGPRAARVLVVDDDPDILDAARLVLEDLGHAVDTFDSGRSALARIAGGARYDLVICDVGMPQLDGWAVAERLRVELPTARVYLVTGWAHEIALDDPRRRFVEGILPKPLPIDVLESMLATDADAEGEPRRAPPPAQLQ